MHSAFTSTGRLCIWPTAFSGSQRLVLTNVSGVAKFRGGRDAAAASATHIIPDDCLFLILFVFFFFDAMVMVGRGEEGWGRGREGLWGRGKPSRMNACGERKSLKGGGVLSRMREVVQGGEEMRMDGYRVSWEKVDVDTAHLVGFRFIVDNDAFVSCSELKDREI